VCGAVEIQAIGKSNAYPGTSTRAISKSDSALFSPNFTEPLLLIPDSVVDRLFFLTFCEHAVVGKNDAVFLYVSIP